MPKKAKKAKKKASSEKVQQKLQMPKEARGKKTKNAVSPNRPSKTPSPKNKSNGNTGTTTPLSNDKENAARSKEETPNSKNTDTDTIDSNDTSAATEQNKANRTTHYNDSDGEASWKLSATSQDDANTINSNETSKYHKGNADKLVLPQFTRYQMMILLDPENKETTISEDDDKGTKAPAIRIAEVLSAFTDNVYSNDKDAKIMSWKTAPNFSYMDSEEFPDEVGDLAKYFQGYRTNVKADKRVYLRVAIHTPNSQSRLYSALQSWMNLFGYSFNKCIIQAETSTCIGWLVYSSQYTDTDTIKQRLTYISQFEWGFKMMAITEEDKKDPWLKRSKAVGIYVPTPMKDTAISIIGDQFEATLDTINNIPDFTDKFLFMEPERAYKGKKSRQLYYKQMVDRHKIHSESIIPEISYGIKVDLDKEFHFELDDGTKNYTLTLRDMILDLKVQSTDSVMYNTRLFHSVDYFADSTNLWINGQRCDGTACCVFTYYDDNASEAETMIRGMGKMIMKTYGREVAEKMFTISHFRGCKGYRWIESANRFSTPLVRQMKANQQQDHMLPAIKILMQKKEQQNKDKLQTEQQEEDKNKNNKKQNKVEEAMEIEPVVSESEPYSQQKSPNQEEDSQDSNVTELLRKKQIANIANIAQDPDLDSIENGTVTKDKPSKITVQDDSSIASSLTNNTSLSKASSISGYSNISTNTTNDDFTISSNKQKYDISEDLIAEIAKAEQHATLTEEELEKRVMAYQDLKINEAKSRAHLAIAEFVKRNNVPSKIMIGKDVENINRVPTPPIDTSPSQQSVAQQITPQKLFEEKNEEIRSPPQSKDKDTSAATPSSVSAKASNTPPAKEKQNIEKETLSYSAVAKKNINSPAEENNNNTPQHSEQLRKSERLQRNQQKEKQPASTTKGVGSKK